MTLAVAVAQSVALAVVGVLLTSFVSVAGLAVGLPPTAALVLATATAALVCLLGVVVLTRRRVAAGDDDTAIVLLGPLLLVGLLVGPGDGSLVARVAIAAALVAASLVGLRAGLLSAGEPALHDTYGGAR